MSTYPNIHGVVGFNEDSRFRGNWTPQIKNPNPPKFFKVAPVARPATVTPAPPPPLPPRPVKPLLTAPDRECRFNIRDRNNDYRGCITDDGECYNNVGELIGLLNDTEAGTPDSEYLGCIRSDDVIEDAAERMAGRLDTGKAWIQDAQGTTVCEIRGTGEVFGHSCTYLGQFEPFSYRDMRTIAMYLLLVDPGMLSEIEG